MRLVVSHPAVAGEGSEKRIPLRGMTERKAGTKTCGLRLVVSYSAVAGEGSEKQIPLRGMTERKAKARTKKSEGKKKEKQGQGLVG